MVTTCGLTEFVGTSKTGDTIGLVIANVDQQVLDAMQLKKKYRSIGILGARTGAGPHIMAADEAVKANKILKSLALNYLAILKVAQVTVLLSSLVVMMYPMLNALLKWH